MANKKKKQNKTPSKAKAFWGRFWYGFRYWFKTLYSNGACLLAREKPWWSSIPVVILAIIIALIPTSVAMGQMNASSFITNSDYGLVTPTAAFVADMKEKNVLLHIEDNELFDENDSWSAAYGANQNGAYYHTVTRDVVTLPSEEDNSSSSASSSALDTSVNDGNAVVGEETIVDFAVFYDYSGLYDNVATMYQRIVEDDTLDDPNGKETYSVTTLFLDSDGYILAILPNTSTDSSTNSLSTAIRYSWDASSYQGEYLTDLLTPTFTGETPSLDSYEYRQASRSLWGTFFDEGYASTKWTAGWTNVGILSAIIVATIFVMGLIIFLATRGKNNPYRPLNFWDAQQVAYFESFTCALIAMILGFMFGGSNYVMSMTIFMMVIAVRVIYTIFKTMRGPIAEQISATNKEKGRFFVSGLFFCKSDCLVLLLFLFNSNRAFHFR